jgi:hypothetical protein
MASNSLSEMTDMLPAMQVVLMSRDHTAQSRLRPEWRFLAKPFAIAALLDAVQGVLRRP